MESLIKEVKEVIEYLTSKDDGDVCSPLYRVLEKLENEKEVSGDRGIVLHLAEGCLDRIAESMNDIMKMEITELAHVRSCVERAVPIMEEADLKLRELIDDMESTETPA